MHLTYAQVAFNAAWGDGGGVYLTGGGVLSSSASGAPTVGGFPRLERNSAGEGAAIYAADGTVVLSSTAGFIVRVTIDGTNSLP